jgi:hypothetical protein
MNKNFTRVLMIAGIFAGVFLVGTLFGNLLMPGIDWTLTYRPVALAALSGESPYTADDTYAAAPWAVIPLIPLALLPVETGRGILFVIGIVAYAFIAIRLGAKKIALAAFLISPPVLHCLLNSNLDWMVLLGLIMPPWIGLIFLAIKPQLGIAVAIFYAVQAFRQGGIKQLVKTIAPVSSLVLLSFAVYGLWPLRFSNTLVYANSWNWSAFPWSIPVGLAVLAYALWKDKKAFSAAASPMLSPYVLLHSWVGVLLPFLTNNAASVIAVVLSWVIVLL